MQIYDFRVEYQKNPSGLSVKIPRFSWKIKAEQNNTYQCAYTLKVYCEETLVWNSGKVQSGASVLVPYGGPDLKAEKKYDVKLEVEDNYANTSGADLWFETGVFDSQSFIAQMITHDFPKEETACPVFYHDFKAEKPVKKAWIYATAHGVYELYINGRRVGNDCMAPGWTSYHKRLQYQYYDITKFIREDNRIEMPVGNGWYKGILSFDCKPDRYGDRVEAFAQIHIQYTDGQMAVIFTDESWQVKTGLTTAFSRNLDDLPVHQDISINSEIYLGETQDTASPKIREGTVSVVPFDKSVLMPQECEPVQITQRFPAKKVFVDPKGNILADFGQNITGLVEVRIKGEKGQKIRIRHAEVLDKDGNFYPDTLRTAISHDTYILSGGEQVLMPHFTFHGFRYIAIDGIKDPVPEMFTACAMHSAMEKIGSFHCSNEKVNQLQSNISWSLRGNFYDIPTDCPQRDERLGWMGDAQVFSRTAAFNRNTARFFTKWMRDVSAESSLEKGVPHIVPDIQGTYASAGWSDAAVIIPWVVYLSYGDTRILEESWQCMHEWVDYIQDRTNENGLWMTNYQYGDWLALDREAGESSVGATDVYLVANAFYLHVTDIVSKTARVLCKTEAAAHYRELYERTLESFREEYYTPRGRIVSETQTGCVLSLYFDLAKDKDRERILRALTTNIENHKNHLTTGFLGTPYLCHALSENGAHDLASILFMREDYPSWLYAVNMGATTLWERWNGIYPDGTMPHPGLNSMNHYANGSIGDWMYQKIGGIKPLAAGYRKFQVKPMFVRGIEEAETSLETPYGKIRSWWCCKNKRIQIKVTVPANTTALIYLPEKDDVWEVGSGDYACEYETSTSLREWRYSLDSTLGEVMAEPLGKQLLDQMVPELMANPMIEYAKRMTLAEGISSAPEIRGVYEAVVRALNEN